VALSPCFIPKTAEDVLIKISILEFAIKVKCANFILVHKIKPP
jgi:hypothetical protein